MMQVAGDYDRLAERARARAEEVANRRGPSGGGKVERRVPAAAEQITAHPRCVFSGCCV